MWKCTYTYRRRIFGGLPGANQRRGKSWTSRAGAQGLHLCAVQFLPENGSAQGPRTHENKCAQTYTRTRAHLRAHTHARTHSHTHAHKHTYRTHQLRAQGARTHELTNAHTHTHTHARVCAIHAHTQIHAHTTTLPQKSFVLAGLSYKRDTGISGAYPLLLARKSRSEIATQIYGCFQKSFTKIGLFSSRGPIIVASAYSRCLSICTS